MRLLQAAVITNQVSSYNTDTSILSVNFDYNADVELPTVAIQFTSSGSTSTSSYFFDTPTATSTLSSPDNKLLTTFITDS